MDLLSRGKNIKISRAGSNLILTGLRKLNLVLEVEPRILASYRPTFDSFLEDQL